MTRTNSSWVAGNQAIPQEPHGFSDSRLEGSNAVFKMIAGRQQWFQVSIPSPTLIDSEEVYLYRVMISSERISRRTSIALTCGVA